MGNIDRRILGLYAGLVSNKTNTDDDALAALGPDGLAPGQDLTDWALLPPLPYEPADTAFGSGKAPEQAPLPALSAKAAAPGPDTAPAIAGAPGVAAPEAGHPEVAPADPAQPPSFGASVGPAAAGDPVAPSLLPVEAAPVTSAPPVAGTTKASGDGAAASAGGADVAAILAPAASNPTAAQDAGTESDSGAASAAQQDVFPVPQQSAEAATLSPDAAAALITGDAPQDDATGPDKPDQPIAASDPGLFADGPKDDGTATNPSTSAGLHINLIADDNNVNAPAGWAAAVRQAADIIEQNFSDPVTINLRYGYGSFRNVIDNSLTGSGGAYANSDAGTTGNYTTVTGWLVNDRTTADDFSSYNALPNNSSSFPGGANNFYVPNGELRALGQLANNSTIDGSVAFGTGISLSNIIPVALHEITHAIGRLTMHYTPGGLPVIADWFRFGSAGNFQWTEGSSSASPSYFSIDNGATRLFDFGQTSDYSDYLNSGVQGSDDPFNEFYSGSTLHSLTTADLREMDVIGFNRVDDYVQNHTTTGVIAVNGSSTGTISPGGDHDWFRVTLAAGTHYRFDVRGSADGGGTNPDPTLSLYDGASNLIASDDDSGVGLNARLFYTPTSSGTYYLDAGAFGSNTGTYTASVTTDDYDNTPLTTGSVAVGGSANGSIEVAGDEDWFRTQLVAGHNYVINLRGSPTGAGTLSDPVLTLYNSAGATLTSNDDGGFGLESQLAVHANSSGTYYLGARGFSTRTGTYRLEVSDTGTTSRFESPHAGLAALTQNNGGWTTEDRYPRVLADVNGDGQKDIVAFGETGIYVALATGGGNFATPTYTPSTFTPSGGGWTSDTIYHREVADVNGDGKADIVGFGNAGVYVALGNGDGTFGAETFAVANFGASNGWTSQDRYPRHLVDVNGDGKADIVGFGENGVYVSLATGGGNFAAPTFTPSTFTPSGGGWTSDTTYHRELGDVNGDGKADIVGFGEAGTYVALGNGDGTFGPETLAVSNFGEGSGGGWSSQDRYPRHLADVNGDGKADIVGFGDAGVYVSLATGGGNFAAPTFELGDFGATAGGWSSDDSYRRVLGDVTGDGRADIVGFGASNVLVAASHDYFAVG
ncbi:NF038122 family metalloprotease [Methylobacterium sp. JK268]